MIVPFCRKTLTLSGFGLAALAAPCIAQTLHNFGNPTSEEQYYIELINRARANPAAEGARFAATSDPDVLGAYTYYGVNLTMMQSEFNAIAATPPLAPNGSLTSAARSHSNWMLANATQAHDETNPANTPYTRMTAAGFNYTAAAENVYASAKSVWHGHAGFEVDWGTGGTGGMQNPRGHRVNIHSSSYREIGVGVALGTNGGVGPQLVTQDFGTQSASPTFGTGVAYYDLNSNNFYDIGEGISGLTVNVSGASYYCTTAAGGGWVVPVPTTATTRTVTFSGLNVNQTANLVVPSATNAKADLKLTYSPPTITSAATASADTPHSLTFTAIGGAASYNWTRGTLAAAPAENCENTTNITSSTTGTYSVLSTAVKQQGTASFHLENSTGNNQSIQLNSLYYGQTTPTISFQSSVRYATSSEFCKVQVKEEGTSIWQDVYSQAGTGTSGEASFNSRSASLTGTSGKLFRVRFLLNSTGSFFGGYTGTDFGWLIDAISFSGVSVYQNTVTQNLAGTSGSFTPAAGTYLMYVAPVVSGRDFPPSYQVLTVSTAVITTPVINTQPASVTIGTGTTATFSVAATGGSLAYQWYAGNSGVTTSPVSGATSSSFTTPALSSTTSYWVRVSNSAGAANSNTATATVITPPSINAHPSPVTINSGSTATFTVSAAGTSPGYQWYAGNSGDTANPVSGATSSNFTTPALSATNNYWVRVSNAVGSANSNTATATVITPPSINTHPASVTINSGSTTTFTVSATGTSPSYQWYAGSSGNTGSPVPGATGSSFTTPALSSTTSYWVRVYNSAGSANSNTATATVVMLPVIVCQPISTTIKKNAETITLTVYATGPSLTYQWYSGSSGNTGNPISNATGSSYTTPTQSGTKTYWVRVSNAAGFVNSVTSTIGVSNNTVTRTFSTWAAELEAANSLAAGAISNANADPDKDGRSNLIEYAFGGQPLVGNDSAPGLPALRPDAANHVLRYQKNTAITDVTLTAQASPTLAAWNAPGTPANFTDVLISTSGTIETREARIPKTAGSKWFLRMKVTQP